MSTEEEIALIDQLLMARNIDGTEAQRLTTEGIRLRPRPGTGLRDQVLTQHPPIQGQNATITTASTHSVPTVFSTTGTITNGWSEYFNVRDVTPKEIFDKPTFNFLKSLKIKIRDYHFTIRFQKTG